MNPPPVARRSLAVLLPLSLLIGCGSSTSTSTQAARASATPSGGTVTVFAAASLKKAFTAEGKAFAATHPGLTVTFSFAGSQVLVAQLQQGAPADVLATADLATITSVRSRLVSDPQVLAHNQLALLVAKGNPGKVTGLTDLARPGVKVVLAGPTVPAGKAAAKALKAAGVRVTPVSLEDAVTGVVSKVRLGEADAGIAYVSDLNGVDVLGTPLPGTTTTLGIAAVRGGSAAGQTFVQFLLSAPGQAILEAAKFQPA